MFVCVKHVDYYSLDVIVIFVELESAEVPPEDVIVISNPLAGGEVK